MTGMTLAAFLGGLLLGGCYFGGLWWTVRRLPAARHVWGLYFGSLALRLAAVLSCLVLLSSRGGWPALAACLLGMMASRGLLIRVLGRAGAPPARPAV